MGAGQTPFRCDASIKKKRKGGSNSFCILERKKRRSYIWNYCALIDEFAQQEKKGVLLPAQYKQLKESTRAEFLQTF